jgi:NhaP-type Na+/H+ or K+/H+ antiporter
VAEERLLGIAAIVGMGIGAQWVAWRLRWPSILLLLITGFIAGPVMRQVEPIFSLSPDFIFGGLLFPFVSVAVAVILFEGGLSLRLDELPRAGGVMWRLISVGAVVTFALSTIAARWVLGFEWPLSCLLAAILVVTGPTVIAPLLAHVRPQGTTGAILKWEGIVIDPIGAMLTVLIFEAIATGNIQEAPAHMVRGVLATLICGAGAGILGSLLLLLPLRRHWIPDDLQNGVALAIVITTFAASNHVQAESGLLAVVVMGIALANQKSVSIRHIAEFKESLRVLLLSGLFIILAARLSLTDLQNAGAGSLAFLAVLILIVRPAAVAAATWRSRLRWQERVFLAWMAPRGIVAAAIASIFSLRLLEREYPGAEQLAPVAVIVIVGTVTFYGLTASPIARRLNLTKPAPRGVLITGAHFWARRFATALKDAGVPVLLVDTRADHVAEARREELAAQHASVQSQSVIDAADQQGLGTLLALTSKDEVNALSCLRFAEIFGRARTYQLPSREAGHRQRQILGEGQHGRLLFDPRATFQWLDEQFAGGAVVETLQLDEDATINQIQDEYEGRLVPLFLIGAAGDLKIFTADEAPSVRGPATLITLLQPEEEAASPPPDAPFSTDREAELL